MVAVLLLAAAAVMPREWRFPEWSDDTYVMLPAAAYDGNRRFRHVAIVPPNNSPWFRPEDFGRAECPNRLIDRVPTMGADGRGALTGDAGDLALPCACFYFPRTQRGKIIFFDQQYEGRNVRYLVTNGLFRVSACAHVRLDEFACEGVAGLYREFFVRRKSFHPTSRPAAPSPEENARLVKMVAARLAADNWKGSPDKDTVWQSGWAGGPPYVVALLAVGHPGAADMARQTLDYMDETQEPSGLFRGKMMNGRRQPERPRLPETVNVQLVRRSAEGLLHSFALVDAAGGPRPAWTAAQRRCADAFVRIFRRYGEIPEYVDPKAGERRIAGTTAAASVPAALLKCAERFGEPSYRESALEICEWLCSAYLAYGLCYGGAGDAVNAPDSESCCALLESCVALAETTGDAKWLKRAELAAQVLSTWVVPYTYVFPAESELGRRQVNTVGAVIANLQNRHAAPGFCISSGDALRRLAKLTGNAAYREMREDVKAFIPQVISTPERPLHARLWGGTGSELKPGAINERVNMSSWEGERGVGEVGGSGCWCEASFLMMQK